MSVFDDWFVHTCDVMTLIAASDSAALTQEAHYGVPCRVEDGTELVRSGDGAEFVSTTQIHGKPTHAAWFTLGSTVTVRGRSTQVGSIDIVDEDPDLDGFTAYLK